MKSSQSPAYYFMAQWIDDTEQWKDFDIKRRIAAHKKGFDNMNKIVKDYKIY